MALVLRVNSKVTEKKKYFAKNLYALKSEIDLKCLNSQGSNCDKVDFDGNYYLLAPNGIYYASKKWKNSRLSSRLTD